MDKNILVLSNISKSYRQGSESISIFDNFNLTVDRGEFISITGPSGSGKTTLLNLVGLIDSIDQGQILLNDKIISNQNSNEKSKVEEIILDLFIKIIIYLIILVRFKILHFRLF